MVDGKVCNALSDTTSTKWYIYYAKSTEINNLEICLKMKFMSSEYFIHLSYRLEEKKWKIDCERLKKIFH